MQHAQTRTASREIGSAYGKRASSAFIYNYFRDYDSSIGRYIESDPIGLDGGLSTFAYADLNPIAVVDPRGLAGNGGDGSGGGLGTGQPYKHCREFNPPQRNFINCKRKNTGKWGPVARPDSWPFPEPKKSEPLCGDDCKKGIVIGFGVVCFAACIVNPACAAALGIGGAGWVATQ